MPAIRNSRNHTLEVTTDAPLPPDLTLTAATPMGFSFASAPTPFDMAVSSSLGALAYPAPLEVKPMLRLQTPAPFPRSPSPISPASPCSDASPVFSSPESSVAGGSGSRHRSRSRSPVRTPVRPLASKRRRSTSNVDEPEAPRPKKGDPDYVKRPENAFILFRRDCVDKRMREMEAAEAAHLAAATPGVPKPKRTRQADLSKTISQQWRDLSPEDKARWEGLAKEKKKEHERLHPDYVYRPQRAKKAKLGDLPSAKGKEVIHRDDNHGNFDLTFPLNPVRSGHGRSQSQITHQTIRIPSVPMIQPFEEPRQTSAGFRNPFMQPYHSQPSTWQGHRGPPTTYGAASLSPLSPTSPVDTISPVTPYDAPFAPSWADAGPVVASSNDTSFVPAPEYPVVDQNLFDMPELCAVPSMFEFSGEFVPAGMVDLLVDADFDISKIEAVTFDELQAIEDGTHPLSTWDFTNVDLSAPPPPAPAAQSPAQALAASMSSAPVAYDVFGTPISNGQDPSNTYFSGRFNGGW